MSEINSQTQVDIETFEKAITQLGNRFKHYEGDFQNFLYREFPDFTFTKIGEEWKATQDLRIKDNYNHCVTFKVSMSDKEKDGECFKRSRSMA